MFTRKFKEPRTLKLLVQLIKVPRVNPLERVASLKKKYNSPYNTQIVKAEDFRK